MTHGLGEIEVMTVARPADARLGVEEMVVAVYVQALVVVAAVLLVELIVDAVRAVAYVTVLRITEQAPLIVELIRHLHIGTVVVLPRI